MAVLFAALIAGATASERSDLEGESEVKPEGDYKPPPGYKAKTRGDKVVYCKKVAIPESRLTTEKCYDETQLGEIEQLMDEQRQEIDQRRRLIPIQI